MDNVVYWLKGEDRQNFGDYLTEYFMKHLFLLSVPLIYTSPKASENTRFSRKSS